MRAFLLESTPDSVCEGHLLVIIRPHGVATMRPSSAELSILDLQVCACDTLEQNHSVIQ